MKTMKRETTMIKLIGLGVLIIGLNAQAQTIVQNSSFKAIGIEGDQLILDTETLENTVRRVSISCNSYAPQIIFYLSSISSGSLAVYYRFDSEGSCIVTQSLLQRASPEEPVVISVSRSTSRPRVISVEKKIRTDLDIEKRLRNR